MNNRKYLKIVHIAVLLLFYRFAVGVLKSKCFDFKITITTTIGDGSYIRCFFFLACLVKRWKSTVQIFLIRKKNSTKKIKINFDSENESQLKRIRKPPLSMSEEKLLAKQIKKTVPV